MKRVDLNLLHVMERTIAGETVMLTVDYSVGAEPNVVEFEGIHVMEGQELPEYKVDEIEKALECGLESDLVEELKEHYRDSGIVFINPHE